MSDPLSVFVWQWNMFKVKVSVVISIDCIESCKSIYHTISVTMVPLTISIVYKSVHVNKNYRMHDGI